MSSASSGCGRSQHPGGQREIDALHVPVDKTIRLVLASQDVIHSFFVPAFRIKHDVVPGTLRDAVVQGDQDRALTSSNAPSIAALQHATMKGEVVVMTPADYARG